MSEFQSIMKSSHPFGGPAGTTFDAVNYRKGGPWANAARTVRFGNDDCVDMFDGPVNPKKVNTKSPAEMTKLIKDLDTSSAPWTSASGGLRSGSPKWLMVDDFMGNPLHFKPEQHKYAIVSLHKRTSPNHPYRLE